MNGLPYIRCLLLHSKRHIAQPIKTRKSPPHTPPIIAPRAAAADSDSDDEETSAALPVGCAVDCGYPGPVVEVTTVNGVVLVISINKVVGCLGGLVKIAVVADSVSAVWMKVTGYVLGAGKAGKAGKEPVGPDAASIASSDVGPMSTGLVV